MLFKNKTKEKNLELEELNLKDDLNIQVKRNDEVIYLYTTEVNDLAVTSGKTSRKIKVSIASAQEDDEILLHKILTKTRKSD